MSLMLGEDVVMPRRDLFDPLVPQVRRDPLFEQLRTQPAHAAGRRLMSEVFAEFVDVDGSFVREFQTGGFSPRVTELALFSYLREQGLSLDNSAAAPDFLTVGAATVAIEVTTANPPAGTVPGAGGVAAMTPLDLDQAINGFVFQMGKAIRRKLLHRNKDGLAYWELPHVGDAPFVVAVQDFHAPYAHLFSVGALGDYLWGRREFGLYDPSGRLTVRSSPLTAHQYNGKSIPSGLFAQPEAEYLSGILFTNEHTVGKFDRLGTQKGYDPPGIARFRFGAAYDPDPDAVEPAIFGYVVGDPATGFEETFTDGLHLFVNPRAKRPIDAAALPGITVHELNDDGNTVTSHRGGLQALWSRTTILVGPNALDTAHAEVNRLLAVGD
ncbi:hypothetical protein ACFYT3_31460 [Nocardia amikacinitolerans]|uniref:hypothetical protein n=1 Tax=Nocardia amikacinitolerans TaxID=756689 RepID=UPI0036B7FF5D